MFSTFRTAIGAKVDLSCKLLAATAFFALATAAGSRAEPILDISNLFPDAGGPPTGATFGWAFTVSGSLDVAALGIFDLDKKALTETHEVGLWNSSGTLLAQALVTATSVPVISNNPANQWLFTNITPIVLGAGTYIVGATYIDLNDSVGNGSGITTIAGVTFGGERGHFSNGSTLTFPEESFPSSPGIFGPDISTTPVSAAAVPEPASLTLLAVGLAGLGMVVRFRRA